MAATRTMEGCVPPASRTVNPGGDGSLKLTREQFRALCHWYQVDDSGRFTHRKSLTTIGR